MTKPQIWVAVFLALFILLFLLGRVSKNTGTVENTPQTNPATQTEELTSDNLSGADLLGRFGCMGCHGAELQGSRMGPALTNVKQHWDSRDNLINYLRNPNSYMDSDRFQDYKEKYPGIIMPSFSNINVKDLGKIADYLLSL